MIEPGRDRLDLGLFEPGDDLVRLQPGREVDIVDGKAQQPVAHRAADVAGQSLVGAERCKQALDAADPAPLGRVELQLHRSLRDRLTIIAAVAPQILRPFQSISIIMTLAALEQGAAPLLVSRVEDEIERRFEPVGDLMLMRLQRKVGRDDAEHRRDEKAGDRTIGIGGSDHFDQRGIEQDFLVRLA